MTTFLDLPAELRQMVIVAAFSNAEEEDRSAILAIMTSAAALAREDRSNIFGFAQVRRTNNSNDTQNYYRVQPLHRTVAVEALINNIIAASLTNGDKIKLGSDVSWVIGQWTAASDKPDVELYRILRDELTNPCPGLMRWVVGYAQDLPTTMWGEYENVIDALDREAGPRPPRTIEEVIEDFADEDFADDLWDLMF